MSYNNILKYIYITKISLDFIMINMIFYSIIFLEEENKF